MHADPVSGIDPSGESFTIGQSIAIVTATTVLGASIGGAVGYYRNGDWRGGAFTGASLGLSLGLTVVGVPWFAPWSSGMSATAFWLRGLLGSGVLAFNSALWWRIYYRMSLDDLAPPNLTPEWKPATILAHFDSLSLPTGSSAADQAIARASLVRLLNTAEAMEIAYEPSSLFNCHNWCYSTINAWRNGAAPDALGNPDFAAETTSRKQFFTVEKETWDRNDGIPFLADSNGHGTIKLTFADGAVAYFDNGWFAQWGASTSPNNRFFGQSNIPPNYTLFPVSEVYLCRSAESDRVCSDRPRNYLE